MQEPPWEGPFKIETFGEGMLGEGAGSRLQREPAGRSFREADDPIGMKVILSG
jgi:hypothetical protein